MQHAFKQKMLGKRREPEDLKRIIVAQKGNTA